MNLTEKQIEDVFEIFYKELISSEIELVGRQVIIENLRIDLLFKDKNGKNVIAELKRKAVSREDIGQLLQYAGTVENSKVILIAPIIPPAIKKSFEHYGIDYMEFSLSKIEKLYNSIKNLRINTLNPKPTLPINQKDYIKVPAKIRDGNIAFKVSYNNKNWEGICTPDIYKYNCYERKMFWCHEQAGLNPNCQSYKDSDLKSNFFPCYDSVANLFTQFTPGWNHGKDVPHVCIEAKVGKIAILTSQYPASAQNSRFIFSIFEIDNIKKLHYDMGAFVKSGTEFYIGNPKTAIKFSKNQYLKYWDFTVNDTNNPRFQKYWGSGLFRYLDDKIIIKILNKIISSSAYDNQQKLNAKILLAKVS